MAWLGRLHTVSQLCSSQTELGRLATAMNPLPLRLRPPSEPLMALENCIVVVAISIIILMVMNH